MFPAYLRNGDDSESAATEYNAAPICPVPRNAISTVSARM